MTSKTSEWSTCRFLLTLGAAGMMAGTGLAGCFGDDGVGGNGAGDDLVGNDDDDNPADDDDQPVGLGTSLTGVVRDAFGAPVADATIRTSTGQSTTSDSDGRFQITGLTPAEDVLVNFSKSGYAKTQTPVDILADVENTVIQVMAQVDFVHSFAASDGLEFDVQADGPHINLPGNNFVDADGNAYTGNVTVEATFYDLVSPVDEGNEIMATPGDFTAVDAAGEGQSLESFGMFQVNLSGEAGEELNLAGATASIVMPVQMLGAPPVVGTTIPAWSYDESTGKWTEEGSGTVQMIDEVLVWVFEAPHFSTWNCDQPLPTHGCVTGQVTNSQGTPRQGATVRAVGLTYIATTTARTAADGTFCLEVKNGETVWLEISYTVGGQPASQRTDPVTIPAGQATCTDGNYDDCIDVGVIPVDIMTCVSGVVVNGQNQPVSGVRVVSPQGGTAETDSNGAFCMAVPVFQTTRVYVNTEQDETVYQPVQLYSQPGLPDCQGGCANIVVLRPYTETSCATGEVIINSQSVQSVPVEAFDTNFPDVRVSSTLTASDGSYCIEIPAGTEVEVRVGSGDNLCGSETVDTEALGGEQCDASSQSGECLQLSAFTCNI
jgi:hypothetical protein